MKARVDKKAFPPPYRRERLLLTAALAVAAGLLLYYLLFARNDFILLVGYAVFFLVIVYDLVRGQPRRFAERLEGERRRTAELEARIEQVQGKSEGKN